MFIWGNPFRSARHQIPQKPEIVQTKQGLPAGRLDGIHPAKTGPGLRDATDGPIRTRQNMNGFDTEAARAEPHREPAATPKVERMGDRDLLRPGTGSRIAIGGLRIRFTCMRLRTISLPHPCAGGSTGANTVSTN